MTRAYKFTSLPDGYSKLAIAALKALQDLELFEIEGKLILTDGIEEYLMNNDSIHYCVHEFASHAELEKWLLDGVAGWIANNREMIELLDQYLRIT